MRKEITAADEAAFLLPNGEVVLVKMINDKLHIEFPIDSKIRLETTDRPAMLCDRIFDLEKLA